MDNKGAGKDATAKWLLREGGSRRDDGKARIAITALRTEDEVPATSDNRDDIQQEIQEAHTTGDRESSGWVYDWKTRCYKSHTASHPKRRHSSLIVTVCNYLRILISSPLNDIYI
jgi:hypothetical protein